MRVRELIEKLQGCDPDATVVFNDAPVIDDDQNLMQGAMQDVVGLEQGFATNGESCFSSESDITFSIQPIADFTVPAVRLVGYSDAATDPNRRVTINGLGPMKDCRPARTK